MAYQCITAYLIVTYADHAKSAVGVIVVLQGLTGFAFPVFGPSLYAKLGYGWGNTMLGLLAVLVGEPGVVFLWVFGEKMRKESRFAGV